MTTTSKTMQGNDVKWCHVLTSFWYRKEISKSCPVWNDVVCIMYHRVVSILHSTSLYQQVNQK